MLPAVIGLLDLRFKSGKKWGYRNILLDATAAVIHPAWIQKESIWR